MECREYDKVKRLLITAILATLLVIILMAAPVLAVIYSAPVAVSENGTASYGMLPIGFAADNEWMIDNGFMGSTALDSRIETLGGLARPHLVTDNMTWFAIAVPKSSQTNLYYTTWNTPLASLDIVLGESGYYTVADNETMEPVSYTHLTLPTTPYV